MPTSAFRWQETIRTNGSYVAAVGYGAILVMVASFGYWAVTAPLAGAAVASGTVAAAGRNVQMQHLEGGVLRDILVREGDRVKKGQVILRVDDTAARTQLNRSLKQWMSLTVRIARLTAERDGEETFRLGPTAVLGSQTVDIAAMAAEEQKEFQARFARFRSEIVILDQRFKMLGETVSGMKSQQTAIKAQMGIIADEIDRKQRLLAQGLTSRSEYSDLLRTQADLLGQTGTLEAEMMSTNTQMAEAREQIERQKTQRVEEAVTALTEARASLADVEEQVDAAQAVLDRTIVHAPADGIVVSAVYNIAGNVISPGEKVMEILPTSRDPLVEARLLPTDVDAVRVGQVARLRFPALNARLTPEIGAVVEHVSADRLVDQATQEPYYRALLKITDDLPNGLTIDELRPGMPVEAFINTSDRTFLEYLMKPLVDSANRAFIEE